MSKNRFVSFITQIMNRNRPEGLIQTYFTYYMCMHESIDSVFQQLGFRVAFRPHI